MDNTLFYGNGFNIGGKESVSWLELLTELSKKHGLNVSPRNSVFTMYYEQVVLSDKRRKDIQNHELHIKSDIANRVADIEPSPYIEEISRLDFNNYITTNYDYSLQKVFQNRGYFFNRKENINKESTYSVRRGMKVKKGDHKIRIWNIHGECKYPRTLMLGYDHYCGYISKLDQYVKGKYSFKSNGEIKDVLSIKKKIEYSLNEFCDNYSWVELSFTTNIHIMGFGLDYSENDIWWLLNKRARLMRDKKIPNLIRNKIVYYGEIDTKKKSYLESFNVEIVEKHKDQDYKIFYANIFKNFS